MDDNKKDPEQAAAVRRLAELANASNAALNKKLEDAGMVVNAKLGVRPGAASGADLGDVGEVARREMTPEEQEDRRQELLEEARSKLLKAIIPAIAPDYGNERAYYQAVVDAAAAVYRHGGLAPLMTTAAIVQRRHQLADERFDEISWMKDRAKQYADPKCGTCGGRGWLSLAMEPVWIHNKLALHGRLRVGSQPRIDFCGCVNWAVAEYRRLHGENMRSSELALQVIKLQRKNTELLEKVLELSQATLRHSTWGGIRVLWLQLLEWVSQPFREQLGWGRKTGGKKTIEQVSGGLGPTPGPTPEGVGGRPAEGPHV